MRCFISYVSSSHTLSLARLREAERGAGRLGICVGVKILARSAHCWDALGWLGPQGRAPVTLITGRGCGAEESRQNPPLHRAHPGTASPPPLAALQHQGQRQPLALKSPPLQGQAVGLDENSGSDSPVLRLLAGSHCSLQGQALSFYFILFFFLKHPTEGDPDISLGSPSRFLSP